MIFGNARKLERSLAVLLQYGTWFASLLMGIGVLSGVFQSGATASVASSLMTVGVGAIIVLPVCRILLMAFMCVAAREYRFACMAAVVLMIVVVSCVIGLKLGVASA